MTSKGLMNAGLLVKAIKEKIAAKSGVGKALLGLGSETLRGAKGVGSVIGAGTEAAGTEAAKRIGGLTGQVAKGAIKASPIVAGTAAANYALDNPIGRVTQQAIQNYKMKQLQNQAIWDPNAGVMY
ncbi:MAG: hypothetical protein ACXAEU_17125 [Candidatus Hodarchaeales archaeon]|jgi:type IV secretory pathway TrbL component